MLIAPHTIRDSSFNLLGHGRADAATIRLLRAGQLSKHVLTLRAVVDAARAYRREAAAAQLSAAVDLLDGVQRRFPAAAADVLGYPLVGAWGAHCLRRLRHPQNAPVPLWFDLAHLSSVAASAAIRAGAECDIAVPARGGAVMLPGLGRARLDRAAPWGVARLQGAAGEYRLGDLRGGTVLPEPSHLGEDRPTWDALRRFVLGDETRRMTVCLDDLDPYRDRHGLGAAARLTGATAQRWHAVLAEAWTVLTRFHPGRAEELAAAPVTVIPLAGAATRHQINATARDSAAAMALSPPSHPAALALALIHEHQHFKLSALLDLIQLFDPEDQRRFYSPWRADPRPLGGLLQGAYAFLGVSGFWRRHAGSPTGVVPVPTAQLELARSQPQVAEAVRTLAGSGGLTALGERFVDMLAEACSGQGGSPMPEEITRLARLVRDDHRLRWRLRNIRVGPEYVEALASAWLRGGSPGTDPPRRQVVTGEAPEYTHQPLHDLARRKVSGLEIPDAGADAALVCGDYAASGEAYLARVNADWSRTDMWAGLALARGQVAAGGAARIYLTQPEVVFALQARLRTEGAAPDPDALASWLAGGHG